MSVKTEKVKVQRNRKRIYEADPEEVSMSEPPQDLEAPEESALLVVLVDSDGMKPLDQRAENQFQEATRIVRHWSAWSAGAGLLPLPLVDMVAMVALQIAMLRRLAALYDVPFHEQRSKSAVAALIGGVNAGYLGGSALKMFPIFGLLSLAAMPAVNGAITYAVGRVFIQHFASGGTFLDFDPVKVKDYFEEQYREGK
jgi:uncharacterized protein (DUF697 family)